MEVYGSMPSVSTMFSPEVEAKIAEQFDVSIFRTCVSRTVDCPRSGNHAFCSRG